MKEVLPLSRVFLVSFLCIYKAFYSLVAVVVYPGGKAVFLCMDDQADRNNTSVSFINTMYYNFSRNVRRKLRNIILASVSIK